MHWLLISARHHPSQGGIGAYAWNFLHAAARHGWRLHLVTRSSDHLRDLPAGVSVDAISTPDDEPSFPDRVERLRTIELIRPFRYGQWSLAAAKHLLHSNCRPDAIEFVDCQAEGYVSLLSAKVRRHFAGVPMIISAHTPMFVEETINGADLSRFGRWIYHEWETRSIAAADGIMAPSAALARRLGREDPLVTPLPLHPRIALAAAESIERRVIRAVGTLQPRKGFDTWVRSLNILFDWHESVQAELIGADTPSGPQGDSFAQYLLGLIQPRFRHRLKMMGAVPHAQAQAMIATAGMIIVPSRFEAFGFVAAEALQGHRPVIVSDAVGLREHVPELPAFAVGDHEGLARVQLRVLLNTDSAEKDAGHQCRTLTAACDVERHLVLRSRFAERLRSRGRVNAPEHYDAIGAMEHFLAEVEQRERSGEPAASTSASRAGS